MRDGSLFLGFDVGTQSTKALLVDATTNAVVARAARAYELLPGLPAGHLEQDPATWIEAVAATAREVLRGIDPTRVAAVGVSGQQHGAVLLDERGQVVRPAKLWCDTATSAEAEWLARELGRPVPTGFTASKVLWCKRHEPERFARVRSVLLPHDYVNLRLTGKATAECGDASGTGWFDPVRRTWDERAMRTIDARLPSMVPSLLGAGEPAGELSEVGAALLSLLPGTLVAAGGGDNMMAAIGSGAATSGVCVVSLGTSGTVFARCEAPVVDPEGLIAPFCSSDGAWLPLLCVMNLTGVTEAVRTLTGRSHDELTRAAASVDADVGGLLWLPFLNGERVPDLPHATGTLCGMRGSNLTPGHLYRAALVGTSCNLALGAARLRALGVPLSQVRLCGGASKNPLWRQLLADHFGAEVHLVDEPEAAALGAAIAALWTHRRARGERLACADAAAPFVRATTPPTVPKDAVGAAARTARFAEELHRLHQVRMRG